jgi:hypothetical protein
MAENVPEYRVFLDGTIYAKNQLRLSRATCTVLPAWAETASVVQRERSLVQAFSAGLVGKVLPSAYSLQSDLPESHPLLPPRSGNRRAEHHASGHRATIMRRVVGCQSGREIAN